MKKYLQERKSPGYIFQGDVSLFYQLKHLNASEQDLTTARERLLKIMERLVKAAEKLE